MNKFKTKGVGHDVIIISILVHLNVNLTVVLITAPTSNDACKIILRGLSLILGVKKLLKVILQKYRSPNMCE